MMEMANSARQLSVLSCHEEDLIASLTLWQRDRGKIEERDERF